MLNPLRDEVILIPIYDMQHDCLVLQVESDSACLLQFLAFVGFNLKWGLEFIKLETKLFVTVCIIK